MKNLSDYSEFSLSELINKISTSRYWNLPKMLAEALRRLTPKEPKYKVYTALLTQSGTDAPVATVLENTLGGDVVWSRIDVGTYNGSLPNGFMGTVILEQNNTSLVSGDDVHFWMRKSNSNINSIEIVTNSFAGDTLTDELLSRTRIEIRVYN